MGKITPVDDERRKEQAKDPAPSVKGEKPHAVSGKFKVVIETFEDREEERKKRMATYAEELHRMTSDRIIRLKPPTKPQNGQNDKMRKD